MTRLRPLQTFARLINGHPFSSDDFADSGDLPVVRIRDLGDAPFTTFISKTLVPSDALVEDGRILIGMDGDFNVRLWDRGPAALNQRVCMLEANPQSDERFLAYALAQPLQTINDLTYATTVKHISGGQILRIMLMDFSFAEQRSIADFLDRETAQIDAMIEAQENVVNLVRERRESFITEAISDFPRVPLKRLIDPDRPLTYGILQAGVPQLDGVPYIGPADIPGEGVAPKLEDLRLTTKEIAAKYHRSVLKAGDVVVSIGPAYGRVMVTTSDLEGSNLTQDTARVALKNTIANSHFVVWALCSFIATEFWDKMINGATFRRLNLGTLGDTPIPFPPISEQRSIAKSLQIETAKADQIIETANDVITLLRERREALITAAVTGRIAPETGIEYPENPETPKES